MTHVLKFRYDNRDFLEVWLPEFDSESDRECERGSYEHASATRLKGSKRSFDTLMIDAFSKAYPKVIHEVKHKEPPIESENYDVPDLSLIRVLLSEVLERIYEKFAQPNYRTSKQEIAVG